MERDPIDHRSGAIRFHESVNLDPRRNMELGETEAVRGPTFRCAYVKHARFDTPAASPHSRDVVSDPGWRARFRMAANCCYRVNVARVNVARFDVAAKMGISFSQIPYPYLGENNE